MSMVSPRLTVLRWLGSFAGFYRPAPSEVHSLDAISRFLYSARSVILVISAQAAFIAGLLALTARQFDWLRFILVLVGFLAAHMISNLSNDYFGYKRGDDTPDSPRMRYTLHPLANGIMKPAALAAGLLVLAVIGAAIAAFFVAQRGWLAGGFLVAGVGLLFAYDAAPVPLKNIGLGEIAVFLVWGPLMVGGGYAMITGRLSTSAFLVSVPYGLGVMSILVGKHIDQAEFDRNKGIRTLPVLLGERAARTLEMAIIVSIYATVAILVALGVLTPFCLIVAIALPRAMQAMKTLLSPRPDTAPPDYAGWPLWYHRTCLVHNRLFGWLYILGLAAGVIWPRIGF